MPGRARGVAHGRGLALGQVEGIVRGLDVGDQGLVVVGPRNRRAAYVVDDDDVAHATDLRSDLLPQGPQRLVDDQDPVKGVLRNIRDVVGKETQVEGVQDRSHAGRRDVDLEMLLMVPAQGRHSFVVPDPETAQGRGQTAASLDDLREGGGLLSVRGPGRHRLARMQPFRVSDQPRKVEGHILHQSLHCLAPTSS